MDYGSPIQERCGYKSIPTTDRQGRLLVTLAFFLESLVW